jgi:hypothetical protein
MSVFKGDARGSAYPDAWSFLSTIYGNRRALSYIWEIYLATALSMDYGDSSSMDYLLSFISIYPFRDIYSCYNRQNY